MEELILIFFCCWLDKWDGSRRMDDDVVLVLCQIHDNVCWCLWSTSGDMPVFVIIGGDNEKGNRGVVKDQKVYS